MTDQSMEALCDEIQEFVGRWLREANLDLSCSLSLNGEVVTIALEGRDNGLVLRDNARLMYSINHLVNQIYYRRAGGEYTFLVDCGDYRGTRVMELQLLARKAAEKVRSSMSPFKLQPMPSSERRVIHMALADEEGIVTESEGHGAIRRVVILPNAS